MPVSARVAWSYLAALLALVVTGIVVALANQTLANLLCITNSTVDDAAAACRLGVAIWVTIVAFVLCLLPALLLVKLDVWLWLAAVAGAGFLVVLDAADQWWWWMVGLLVPALAALVSARWSGRRGVRRWQEAGILTSVAAAVAALAWWYVNG